MVFFIGMVATVQIKKKKKMMKGTKKPNVYVGALVCTTGAWVIFIGTVAIVQTKKKKKTQ